MSELKKINKIVPNTWNKRGDEGIEELSASIATNGLLQPIVVRPVGKKFEVVAGERRWRACKMLKMDSIDCTVKEVDEPTARAITMVENKERKRLSPFEEMEELLGLLDGGRTGEEIAAMTGWPVSFVRRRLVLRNLNLDVLRDKLAKWGGKPGSLDEVPLLALELLAASPRVNQDCVELKHLASVKSMRRFLVKDQLMVTKASWLKQDDFDGIVCCADCPERTGSEGSLFPDLSGHGPDLCLNPKCWAEKARAHALRVAGERRDAGDEVVLIGEDFDTPIAEENAVERAADYVAAKKGDKHAVSAVVWDGPDGGRAVYVKPVRKGSAPEPDRLMWKWIGGQCLLLLGQQSYDVLAMESEDPAEMIRYLATKFMRFGCKARGVNFELPFEDSCAGASIQDALKPGVVEVLKGLGADGGDSRADMNAAAVALKVFWGGKAVAKISDLISEWTKAHPAKTKLG